MPPDQPPRAPAVHLDQLSLAARLASIRPSGEPVRVPSPLEVEVRSSRLILRPLRLADRSAFISAIEESREELAASCSLHKDGESDDDLFRRYVEMAAEGDRTGLAFRRAAFLDDGTLVGGFNLNDLTRGLEPQGEANWWVRTRLCGRGLATEGVGLLLEHAFGAPPMGLGLSRVLARISPMNEASLRIASRLGFRPEIRENEPVAIELFISGRPRPHLTYVAAPRIAPPGPPSERGEPRGLTEVLRTERAVSLHAL